MINNNKVFFIVFLNLSCISCAVFPHNYKYYYINYPNDSSATHEKTSDYVSPPALIRFRYQKIYFTALIQENEVFFGLELPQGNTVKLIENKIKLKLNNGNNFDVTFHQTDRSYSGPALPPNWAFDRNYPINKDGFGVLHGGTVIKNWPLNRNVHFYVSYYYQASVPLGKGLGGTLILPKLLINSKPCEGPSVQFEWRERLGVGYLGA